MVFPLCLNGAFAGVTSVFKSVLMSGLFLDFSRGREGCPRMHFNEGGVKKHRGLKCRAARPYTQWMAMLRFLTLTRCRQLLAPIGCDREIRMERSRGPARRGGCGARLDWKGVTDGLRLEGG